MTEGAILVTGAGGFVCSEVVLALHRAGRPVVATDQAFDTATAARLVGVEMVEGPLDAVLGSGQIWPLSCVIHGAAITASPEMLGLSHAAHIRRNMDALTATLDHAVAAGASSFLFLSSMGVFDPNDAPIKDGRFIETTRPTATCTYCAAKQAGELLTTSAAQEEFTTLSLRLGNIFGPHEMVRKSRQHLCLVSRMFKEAQETGLITVQTPEAKREWSWLPDLARMIAALIQNLPSTGPRVLHAGTPPVLSDLDLAKGVAKIVGDTVIRLAPPPHAAIRAPMGSRVPSVFDKANWTRIEAALVEIIDTEVAV